MFEGIMVKELSLMLHSKSGSPAVPGLDEHVYWTVLPMDKSDESFDKISGPTERKKKSCHYHK